MSVTYSALGGYFVSEYHFDLRFIHKLIDSTVGYNYDAVSDWTGFTNIFTRNVVHFSAVFNKHHILYSLRSEYCGTVQQHL